MYRSESEVRQHFGTIPPTQIGTGTNINPRTGKPYGKNTWAYWRWFYGLTDREKSIIADLEA